MGKQYAFTMDTFDEYKLMEYLQENGYFVYKNNKEGAPSLIDHFAESAPDKGGFIFYLYKTDFGKLIFKETPNGLFYINDTYAPVIEFSRTIVRHETKKIKFGRIWIGMEYYNESGELLKKNEALNIGFHNIKKWINKNLDKVDIRSKDIIYNKCVISKSLIHLIEVNGYKFE